jgi:hypothetical protein
MYIFFAGKIDDDRLTSYQFKSLLIKIPMLPNVLQDFFCHPAVLTSLKIKHNRIGKKKKDANLRREKTFRKCGSVQVW